jgi:RNA polymerase sigma-70 factor (ECF subfamily)
MVHLEDKILVSRLKSGDKNAFKLLFEKYYPLFISFTKRLLKDEVDAEDLIQNVFMRIWVGRANLDEDKNFKNYLLVSVRNEIYQYFRHHFRIDDTAECPEVVDTTQNIDTEISAKELEKRITDVIMKMPQRRREIFNLSRLEKLSNQEISTRLGISVRTVEKHIENALKDIRQQLNISVLILTMILW